MPATEVPMPITVSANTAIIAIGGKAPFFIITLTPRKRRFEPDIAVSLNNLTIGYLSIHINRYGLLCQLEFPIKLHPQSG
jgi:hypothetical protein